MKRIAVFAIAGLVLSAPAFSATVAYYRFETGPAGATASSIVDSSGNGNTGTIFAGAPKYNSSVPVNPIPATGAANLFSLSLGTADAASFAYAFPFNSLANVTLEFWVRPTAIGSEGDIFWTRTDAVDSNRFNMRITPAGGFGVDYRTPTGTLHTLINGGTVTAGQWSFIALVKSGNNYTAYVNGTPLTGVDSSPSLPNNTGWTINGRGIACCQFSGLIDEVRLSDQALSPSQFLNAVPEPGTLLLFLTGLAALISIRRRD